MSIAPASIPVARSVRQRAADLLKPSVLSVLEQELPALGFGGHGLRPFDFNGVRSWNTTYGSTSGPFGGVGGAAVTRFNITVLYSDTLMIAFAVSAFAGVRGVPTLYGAAAYDTKALEQGDLEFFSRVTAVRAD